MKKNKITVLYVHANNEDVGGADYCLFKLAAELDKEIFRPVVCLSKNTDIVDLYKNEGIKTYLIDMERIKKTKNPWALVKLCIKFSPTVFCLMKIIRDEQVDIIHGNDLLDIYGPVAGRLCKIPTTQYIRWILVSPLWFKKMLTQLVWFLNDRVVSVSDGVGKDMFPDAFSVGHPKLITCYDWIDMDKVGHGFKSSDIRDEYDIPEDSPLVGCVGRLDQWKGQDVFIKAAGKVSKRFPDAVFLVVGGDVKGRNRERFVDELKTLGQNLGIEKQLIFTGHRSDISNVMKSLDVFVHSSKTPDPLPGVVLEAMYCSRPVVGANAGGVPEEVANNKTGLLYIAGDHKDMAEKIIWFLENPEEARKMGTAGRERVEQVFDKRALCPKMENIYTKMIGYSTNKN